MMVELAAAVEDGFLNHVRGRARVPLQRPTSDQLANDKLNTDGSVNNVRYGN